MAGLCTLASASVDAQQPTARPPERSVIRSRGGIGVPGTAPANPSGGGWSSAGGSRTTPAVPPTRLPNSRLPASSTTVNRSYSGPTNSRVPGGIARSGQIGTGTGGNGTIGSAPVGSAVKGPGGTGAAVAGPSVTGPQTRRGENLPESPPEEVFAEEPEGETYAGPPVPPGYVVEIDEPMGRSIGPYEDGVMDEDEGAYAYPADDWFGGRGWGGYGWGGQARGHGPGHGGHTCPTCGGMGCPGCWFGGYGLLNGLYLRGEYLRWQGAGMHVPALVTTNTSTTTPPVNQAGVLGAAGTQVLFGDREILDNTVSGGRFYAGLPIDYDHRLILEGEYFSLEEATESFSATSNGTPILARPFFNMLTSPNNVPAESSELVAYPGVVRGTVGVEASSTFQGAAARLRYLLCCSEGCVPALAGRRGEVPGGYRMELTGGYRYLKLQDNLFISENLTSTSPTGTFEMFDSFATDNQFNGVELGVLLQTRRGRWTMDWVSRLGIGSTSATSTIAGQTSINNAAPVAGALLAQTSNIGTFDTSDFALAPELGLTLGFDLTPRFRLLAGYSMIYWSRVLRAGEQIDRDVNPNLIPPAITPLIGPLRPDQHFVWSDFWAQGVSVGLEGHW